MKLIFLFLVLLLTSCGDKQPEPVPTSTSTAQKRAITEVQQTLDLGYEQAWSSVLTVLNQRDISTDLLFKEQGRITTDWVNVQDKMCNLAYSEDAPLSCRVRYSLQLQPLSPKATAVSIRYVEKCLGREEMELVCPGSNAEKKMIAIIEDLKALIGVQ